MDDIFAKYTVNNNLGIPKGINKSLLFTGDSYTSNVNKLHLIRLHGLNPDDSVAYTGQNVERFKPKTFLDLCRMSGSNSGIMYDAEDFLYCKKVNFPLNRLITLRRFPLPCTDNVYDAFNQAQPDIARMVTYMDQNTNKLEEMLSFNYGLKWKELTAEMEEARMEGDQSGFSDMSKSIMKFIDPRLAENELSGKNKLDYDPKHDQNKVYGPVDSITQTHIRDVGLEFEKEFSITFEYELRSINGNTPEFAMKDVLANVLATTYNNAKFWAGSRYWVGERPSRFAEKMQYMNPESVDEFLNGAYNNLKGLVNNFSTKGGKIAALKNVLKNGIAIGLGKILDSVGRPSILVMNSLLSGEPTGYWHLTIGNPDNPTMCIGNLLLQNVDVTFPTDSLSYGDFPTKMQVVVKLKPGQPKDKAGIETMFNHGRSRIYYNPKKVSIGVNSGQVQSKVRNFFGFDNNAISETLGAAFDFLPENEPIETVRESVVNFVRKTENFISQDNIKIENQLINSSNKIEAKFKILKSGLVQKGATILNQ